MSALPLVALMALAPAADPSPKRLLFVTHSTGFIHPSVGTAEDVMKQIGPKNGFAVTAWRFTGDPADKAAFDKYATAFRGRTGKTIEPENCGRINKETLKNFDVLLFYTTGNPLTKDELADVDDWVKAGGALCGVHSGSDTLYAKKETPWNSTYGDLIGGYFNGHPWHQKVKLVVEDPNHAGAMGFQTGSEITDEIYQFSSPPYSREKLHVILSIDPTSIPLSVKNKEGVEQVRRTDKDFAVAWCQEVGKGKTFYTSLGHRDEVWKDPRFEDHLIGGLKWATGQAPGDATPSAKIKK